MRLAVGLFGIHFVEDLNHWANWTTSTDYRKTYQNNRDNIYSCFKDTTIDYFSATYHSPVVIQLEKDYKFHEVRYFELDSSTPIGNEMFTRRNQIFKRTIELILDSKSTYDCVLITRYDMLMKKKIDIELFNYDKVNVFYQAKWGSEHDLCDDNFYFMSRSKLEKFYNDVCALSEEISSHRWSRHLPDLHYMYPGSYYSHESTLYAICRTKLIVHNN